MQGGYLHKRGWHNIVDGYAVRTDAAKRRDRHIAYKRAGVPEIHLDTPIAELGKLSVWSRVPTPKARQSKPVVYWLCADPMNARALASWCYMLKSYVDAGIGGRYVKWQQLIDAQFDAAEKSHWRAEIRELPLFIVDLTNTGNHKFTPTLLADVHAERTRMCGTTLYLSDDDIGERVGKYGDAVARLFRDRQGMRRIAPRNSGSRP